jgi:hypothetical protein
VPNETRAVCTSGIGGVLQQRWGQPERTRHGQLADRQIAQDGVVPDGRLDLKKVGRAHHYQR